MTALIDVENLTLKFRTDEGLITAVDNVSFSLNKGEVMGLVGESGSGKSVTAKALMHLNAKNAVYTPESKITLHTDRGPVDVLSLRSPRELNIVRGGAVSMIFQEPMTSLNPVFTVGQQIAEAIRLHQNVSANQAFKDAIVTLQKKALRIGAKAVVNVHSRYEGKLSDDPSQFQCVIGSVMGTVSLYGELVTF